MRVGEVAEAVRQRRQLGGVEVHRASLPRAARRNRFRAASRTAPILAGCCGDSTSGGRAATCAAACPAPRPRWSRPSTRCGPSSPTCGRAATRPCASSRERFDGAAIDELRVPDAEVQGRARRDPGRPAGRPRGGPRQHHRLPRDAAPRRRRAPQRRHRRPRAAAARRPGRPATCRRDLAPLVSTVLMTAVPAKVAGVPEVVLVTSPQARRHAWPPGILAAAALAGVDEVYRVGGPAVIGALAYGTESIRAGRRDRRPRQRPRRPGQARGRAAGPGRRAVGVRRPVRGRGRRRRDHAGRAAPPSTSSLQAEHGPDGLAWLITWDEAVADAVAAAVAAHRAALAAPRAPRGHAGRGRLRRRCATAPEQAIAVANAIAPEHLELLVADPEALLPLVRHAGAVFCGPCAPGVGRRLPRRPQPRAAHLRLGPLLRRAARRRLPQARPRRVLDRGRARRGRRRTSTRSPPPRASTPTPSRSASARGRP